jgi:hypothetical protein
MPVFTADQRIEKLRPVSEGVYKSARSASRSSRTFADRAERKVIDRIVEGLKFHSGRVGPINSSGWPTSALKASCKDVNGHDQEG